MVPTSTKPSLSHVKLSLSLIYFLFMSARAVFGPFVTVYLGEKGLDAEAIGMITGINSLVIILSQPLWGIVADRFRSVKRTLMLCIVAQALFALSLMAAEGSLLISACFCVYTAFSSAEGPLLDSWSLRSIKEVGDEHAMGQLKLWGCIGFSCCSVLAGQFIKGHSASAIIPIFSAVLLATTLALKLVRAGDLHDSPITVKDMQLGRILKDSRFLIFLGFIFAMQLGHRASYTFYPLLIQQLGGDASLVGYASALMFVSQAVVMLVSRRLFSRFAPENLVVASAVSFAAWHAMLRLSTSPWHVVLSCVMDGPSFALFTLGTLYYMDKIAPKALHTTYQSIAYGVYFGLSGMVGNVLGGRLLNGVGYQAMYSISIAVTLCSTVLFLLALRLREGRKEAAND